MLASLFAVFLQGGQCGQVTLHMRLPQQDAASIDADAGCVQLLWSQLQPGLLLCVLSNDWPVQLLRDSVQQLLASFKLDAAALAPLLLPEPVVAAVVADAGRHWVTCSTGPK
jgi:hypothetical protein